MVIKQLIPSLVNIINDENICKNIIGLNTNEDMYLFIGFKPKNIEHYLSCVKSYSYSDGRITFDIKRILEKISKNDMPFLMDDWKSLSINLHRYSNEEIQANLMMMANTEKVNEIMNDIDNNKKLIAYTIAFNTFR